MSNKLSPSSQSSADAQRLDRIEAKIDRLAEAIVSLARAEEKLVSLETNKTYVWEKITAVEDRVTIVEKKTDESVVTLSVFTKVFWITTTALIATTVGAWFVKK